MTHDPREALQYIADNDIPYLKTSVPVPKGWPGHYGYMAKQALAASAPKGEPCAYADWGQIVQSLLRSMDATIKDESSRDQAVRMADELCSKYPSPPPAAGWDDAIEACKRIVANRDINDSVIGMINAIEALRREAPAFSGATIFGGTALCGHGVMAAICEVCNRPDAGGGVRVKPLEWRGPISAFPTTIWEAKTTFGHYVIEEVSASDSPAYEVRFAGSFVSVKDCVDDAKSTAQSDYKKRILSALSTPSDAVNEGAEARLREALRSARLHIEYLDAKFQPMSDTSQPILSRIETALGRAAEAKKSAPVFKASHNHGESDPSATPDCAGADTTISTVGDGAKSSEGGAGCCNRGSTAQGKPLKAIEPSAIGSVGKVTPHPAGVAPGPSDPSAERREIVARNMVLNDPNYTIYHMPGEMPRKRRASSGAILDTNELSEDQAEEVRHRADKILAALDGGAGE